MKRTRLWAAGILLAAAFACGANEPVQKTFDLAIEQGLVPVGQRAIRAAKGNNVRLRVTSDVAGGVQVPGYESEAKVQPGKTTVVSFIAKSAGTFPIYWQPEVQTAPKPAKANTAPLAVLEVRVR